MGVHTVDVRGLCCPMPVVQLSRAAKALSPGERIEILGDERGARRDIEVWCRRFGYTVSVVRDDEPGWFLSIGRGDTFR